MGPWSGLLCLAFAMQDGFARRGGCAGRDGVRRGLEGSTTVGAVVPGGGVDTGWSSYAAAILLLLVEGPELCMGAGKSSHVCWFWMGLGSGVVLCFRRW